MNQLLHWTIKSLRSGIVLLCLSTLLGACSEIVPLPRHPNAKGAVDRLMSNDTLLQSEAQVEILALGEGAVPDLQERFNAASADQRKKIIELVASIGKPDRLVIDLFSAAAQDSSPTIRKIVAFRAADLTHLQTQLFPAVRRLAWDSVPEIQAAAISALSGFSAQNSLPANELLELMQSPAPIVVAAAASSSLNRSESALRAGAQEALPNLIGEIMNPAPLVRAAVIIAIGKYGPSAQAAAQPLADAVTHDQVPEIRLQAAIALLKIESRSGRAVAIPALEEFANCSNPILSEIAGNALKLER